MTRSFSSQKGRAAKLHRVLRSTPPNSAALGTGGKWQDWKMAVKGSHISIYNQEKNIRDLKISGDIRVEAINGGAVLGGGGDDCISIDVES